MRALQQVVDALLDEATIDAVVRDGWPRPMVEAGFAMHRTTWNLELLHASLQVELRQLPATRTPPATMTHIWPALPGAGVTPVLAAALLGVREQSIRPSRRGAHFARRVAEVWRDIDVQLASEVPFGERVVVSGSDETVDAVIAAHGAANVVGYGDRESFAVVQDDGDATRHVDALARDVVMWFGRGCFSAHAVIFLGDRDAGHAFGAALADAIARREALWCPAPEVGMLATRMQRLAVAQFETTVWPARVGWVELRDRWMPSAADRAANVVTLCIADDVADLDAALGVPPRNRQGVAWCGLTAPPTIAGVTRICEAGQLQAPPADWPHDGVSNAAALLGFRSGRIGVS